MESIHKVLIRTPNWMGDCIMSIPTILNLIEFYKDSKVTILTRHKLEPIFEALLPKIEILSLDYNDAKAVKLFVKKYRDRDFNLGIIFPLSFSSARLMKRLRVKTTCGFNSEFRGLYLNKKVPYSKKAFRDIHLSKRFQDLFTYLTGKSIREIPVSLNLNEQKIERVLSEFNLKSHTYGILSPGATYGPAKRWNFSNFIEVGKYFKEKYNIIPVIIGLKNEVEINAEIPEYFMNLLDKTDLMELLILISQSKIFVTNDSGPMHAADILKIPLVAVFGSTNPVWTGPRSEQACIVSANLDCAPCYKKHCKFNYICLNKIIPNDVLLKLNEVLGV